MEKKKSKVSKLDPQLAEQLENQLNSLHGINQAVVELLEEPESIARLNLSDLFIFPRSSTQYDEQNRTALNIPARRKKKQLKPAAQSICDGGELQGKEEIPKTLSQVLERAVRLASEKGIVYVEDDGSESFQTYHALLKDAEGILAGLRQEGLKRCDIVIFQFDRNVDFLSCFWACVLGGFVLVPIAIPPSYEESNSGIEKLINAWKMLDHPTILSSERHSSALRSLAERMNLKGFRVVSVNDLRQHERDMKHADIQPEDTALMLLTSGSTGTPKAVIQSHRNIVFCLAGMVQFHGFTSEEVSVNWIPLDHVGGIVFFHLRDVYLTCQQVHIRTETVMQDSLKWLDVIDRYRATVTWAPNFAFGLVNSKIGRGVKRNWDMSSMRCILNGGEAVVAKTARRFLSLLSSYGLSPDSMYPAWGMSETCGGVIFSNFSLGTTRDDDQFVELGRPIPGISIRIADEKNRTVAEEVKGELQIKGNTVTPGYYKRLELNREVFTKDGWFKTGDLGFMRDSRVTLTGRAKDEIIINGVNYYSYDIESVVESVEGVEISYTAAVPFRNQGDETDKLAVFFNSSYNEWEQKMDLIRDIRLALVRSMALNPDIVLPVMKKDIPKTEIGKIQRSRLSQQLINGDFDDVLRKLKVKTRYEKTVPDWFYKKVWLPRDAENVSSSPPAGQIMIFLDSSGLGQKVFKRLKQMDQSCIRVEEGNKFTRLAEDHYRIDPRKKEHYDRLLDLTYKKDNPIECFLHMWSYGRHKTVSSRISLNEAQNRGIFSLLNIIQSLTEKKASEETIRLFAVSSHTQATGPLDTVAFEKSTLNGFLKVLAVEESWIQCRHIDFEMTGEDEEFLMKEIFTDTGDAEIAYRQGVRLKSFLSKIDMLTEKPAGLPLKYGGFYLVTGGLGGIGSHLSSCLIEHYNAKLLLVGRTELPDRSKWDTYLDSSSKTSERIKNYLEIEKNGGEIIYECVDIGDLQKLQSAVSRAEKKWNTTLSGIFHLAGDMDLARHWIEADRHRLIEESRGAFEAMFQAKVYGTWNLFQLIRNQPEVLLVAFSSVVSELGGSTFGAYCAGNSFLDSCCLYHYHTSHKYTCCNNWAMWENLGMSRENPEFARQAAIAMGNMIIEKDDGWYSMLAALSSHEPQLFIGLNSNNPHIQERLDQGPQKKEKIYVYISSHSDHFNTDRVYEQIKRKFNVSKVPFEVIQLPEIPINPDGSVDFDLLHQRCHEEVRINLAGEVPQTDAEKRIVAIWKEVLNLERVGIHDNFFDLGGNSLSMSQVNGRLQEEFGSNISMTEMFQYSTISSLAEYLIESPAETVSQRLKQGQDRGSRRREQMQRRKHR